MDIELKNIKVYDDLTEETLAYSADLFIMKGHAGKVSNSGRGEMDRIIPIDMTGQKLINMAREWCKTLPPEKISVEGHVVELKQSLESFVGNLLNAHVEAIDKAAYISDVTQLMKSNIIFGKPYESCRGIKLSSSVTNLLKTKKGQDELNAALLRILTLMTKSDKILNWNLPDSIKKGIDAEKFFQPEVATKQRPRKQPTIPKQQGKGRRK